MSVSVCVTAFVVTVVGFWPSFFSQLGRTGTGHLIHGFSATAWMALPLWQAVLIRKGQVRLHRQIGRWSLVLVAGILLSGVHMVQAIFRRWEEEQALRLLEFAFADLLLLGLFAAFVIRAIQCARRHDLQGHLRYITGTVLLPVQPALVRFLYFFVPGVSSFEQAFWVSLGVMEVVLGGLIGWEWRKGRIRLPFAAAFALFVLVHLVAEPVAKSPAFSAFATWVAKL